MAAASGLSLPILQVGEPVLRQPARLLTAEEIRSAAVRDLIERMRETLLAAPGVGLAAPQVGESLQLAVIEDRAEYQALATPEELAARERVPVPFHLMPPPAQAGGFPARRHRTSSPEVGTPTRHGL